ncbi:MAG: APC family permease [Sphaerochaetaceae bacterium]|nr:APC family permease [Sphaerochaetaceae bacterium]
MGKKCCTADRNKNDGLGLSACTGIIVGGCIGSAIFSLSGQTIFYAGPASIISWTVAAFVLALYGMQVCELALRFPHSGGIFIFPKKALNDRNGDFWAFVSAWGYIVSNITAIAFSATAIGNFTGNGFGLSPEPFFTTPLFHIDITWTVLLAVIGIVFCLILNLMKISDAGRLNNVLVAILTLSMLIFAGFAFFGKRPDGTPAFTAVYFHDFFSTGMGVAGMFKAIPIAAVAFGSCVAISFMADEVKQPEKTIPMSLFVGIAAVTVLYLLMLIATIGTCNHDILVQLPFLQFAPQFGSILNDGLTSYPALAKLIAIAAVLALITTMLVLTALNARAMQAVSASGYLPEKFAQTNRNGVPSFSAVICSLIAVILSLKPDIASILVNLGALLNVVSMTITCVSLIVARKKTKLPEGSYRAPFGDFSPLFTIAILAVCYLVGNVTGAVAIFTFVIYTVGITVFFLQRKKSKIL